MAFTFSFPYRIHPLYQKRVAYFSMEYGIHQPLKIYAGGLGFLAGSHMRSAYDLRQHLVGVGILWKYGYYDQVRKQDQTMDVLFQEKTYGFLQETGIRFQINVSKHNVWVTALYLPPEIFGTAPLFLLSTDLPENDYLAQTICHKLYDSNPETKIAAAILLGIGGAKLLDLLEWSPQVYHLNESHALPLAFYLYRSCRDLAVLKKKFVFTNHTPEEAGNQRTSLSLLDKMGFFADVPLTEVRELLHENGDLLNHTLAALQLCGKANAVSKLHLATLQKLWGAHEGICPLLSITNAQHFGYWHLPALYASVASNDTQAIARIKKQHKRALFEEVADQCGEMYNEDVCTIVFAKRFTGYKRPELLFQDEARFHRLVTNKKYPVQVIWAGKPYPVDYASIGVFDKIVNLAKKYSNCAVLVGYEMKLSRLLKRGADLWLNVPRMTHEASGTSGMAAAMNGALNIGLPDGWFPEFAQDKVNAFVIPASRTGIPEHEQDAMEASQLYQLLEDEVLPMYYNAPDKWYAMIRRAMLDIVPSFGSDRMADAYYRDLYA